MNSPGLAWKMAVLRRQPVCVVCGGRGFLKAHHVITKQKLRRELGKKIAEEVMWDPRNGMTLCEFHHSQHHCRAKPVPLEKLSHENWNFAMEHDLTYVLEITYPSEDESVK
jgi:hypothetical protein